MASDPTMRLKNNLMTAQIHQGKGWHKRRIIQKATPTLYGFPKIHKVGMPLRPMVSSIGTVTYQTVKEVARMLKHLVGKSPHHVRNTQDFIYQIKGIHLNQDQCMMSYDTKALFTSVPTTQATNIIKKLL